MQGRDKVVVVAVHWSMPGLLVCVRGSCVFPQHYGNLIGQDQTIMNTAVVVTLLATIPSCVWGMKPPWDSPDPLYNSSDPLTLLDNSNLKSHVLNSDTAWLVEFYSSWCGHCVNYAPTFRQLAKEVRGWKRVIQVGAIDCANDDNIPICREFDVLGYPSLKMIPPRAPDLNLGSFDDCRAEKDIQASKTDMINFVAKVQMNSTFAPFVKKWPIFLPFQFDDLSLLWHETDSPFGIIVFDDKTSQSSLEILMELSEVSSTLDQVVPLRRVVKNEAPDSLLKKLNVLDVNMTPQIVAVDKATLQGNNLTPRSGATPNKLLVQICKEFIDKNRKVPNVQGAPKNDDHGIQNSTEKKVPRPKNPVTHNPHMIHKESDIKQRRYTVFMADLERTILYSFGHEVAQHQMIAGDALNALQDYVAVLVKYFPARHRTKRFLEELRSWILGHDDAIRGEDLSVQVEVIKKRESSFDDLPNDWIGCKGSSPQYGGYPCGLWSLFHTLTVNHAQIKGKASQREGARTVVDSMAGFIEHFFSCRECARHFTQAHEGGKVLKKEVETVEDAILWLWKTHNKVNLRLSGDITDDNAYPKEKFPNHEHCTDCYNLRVGGANLWSEFRLKNVLIFLKQLYGKGNIDMRGLVLETKSSPRSPSHDLILPMARERLVFGKEDVDKMNFGRRQNEQANWSLFTNADVSLCFSIYLISALILFVVYLKFIAKRKFSWLFTNFCPRSRSSSPYTNPLLGKA